MNRGDKPVDVERVACEVCLKEVPKSEATVPEASPRPARERSGESEPGNFRKPRSQLPAMAAQRVSVPTGCCGEAALGSREAHRRVAEVDGTLHTAGVGHLLRARFRGQK